MGFLGVAVILKSVLVSQPRKSHYCITNSTMTAVGNKFFPYYVTNQPAARRIIIWRKFRIFSFAEVHVRTTQRTLLDYLRTSMTKFFFSVLAALLVRFLCHRFIGEYDPTIGKRNG